MMRHAMMAAVAIALLLMAGQSNATQWCGRGPHSKPDHPCEDDNDAVDAAAAKYDAQWKSLSGVVEVSGSLGSDSMEIDVTVEPPTLIPAIRAVLPTEANGFPVRVVPRITGVFLIAGQLDFGPGQDECAPPSSAQDEQDSGADSAEPTPVSVHDDSESDPFTDAMLDDETNGWMDLPGVLSINAAQCGKCDCDPPKIAIDVQPSMMASVRKQIPETKFGFPIVLVQSK